MIFLKYDTAPTVLIGPFVDETDGKTAETGLSIARADVLLWKQGYTASSTMTQKSDTGACTAELLGYYSCPLNQTDTNTVGQLVLSVHMTGALPVRHEFMVMPANVWDSLFGSDVLQVDIAQINNSTSGVEQFGLNTAGMTKLTVDTTGFSATATEFETSSVAEATANHYVDRLVLWTTGVNAGKVMRVNAYSLSGGRGHFTITDKGEAPANGNICLLI